MRKTVSSTLCVWGCVDSRSAWMLSRSEKSTWMLLRSKKWTSSADKRISVSSSFSTKTSLWPKNTKGLHLQTVLVFGPLANHIIFAVCSHISCQRCLRALTRHRQCVSGRLYLIFDTRLISVRTQPFAKQRSYLRRLKRMLDTDVVAVAQFIRPVFQTQRCAAMWPPCATWRRASTRRLLAPLRPAAGDVVPVASAAQLLILAWVDPLSWASIHQTGTRNTNSTHFGHIS
jgi:hypothetical protein